MAPDPASANAPFSNRAWTVSDFRGRRVTVMGLGLFGGGRELTRFLASAGADVLVTDLRDAGSLRSSLETLESLPIRWVLGEHRERDFLEADVVFANPAVRRDAPLLRLCVDRGIPLETEMNLFFKLCRARICAITGSNGKTTTASLAAEMIRQARPRTRLGGNVGRSLLGEIEALDETDWVVLELSSFQLEDLASIDRRPEIAAITNVSPNHLDRHGTYETYLAAKRTILDGDSRQHAVLCGDDPVVRGWAAETRRQVTYYGRSGPVRPRARGVWVEGKEVVASGDRGEEERLFSADDLRLAGRFNLINAAGAAALAKLVGCSAAAIRDGARAFQPVEHRLELVREVDGVKYYDDSIATTPESALCAIDALGPALVLIAGGSDKGSSFGELGRVAARRTRGVVLLGQTAAAIERAVLASGPAVPVHRVGSLEEAVETARRLARPGDSVALSPACASYDMFTHFAERGQRFKDIVRGME